METQKPIAKFRAGQVTCALWQNEAVMNGGKVSILRATVERRYKDKDGMWKSSGSFGRNEIPLAIFVLEKAFEAMLKKPDDQDTPESVPEERVV